MARKPKIVGFTPERGRRVRKNAGGVHTSVISQDTRPRNTNVFKLYVFTVTTAFSAGECVATISTLGGDEVSTGTAVIDPTGHMANVPVDAVGLCVLQDSAYYAITPYVTSVNWSSPNLTYNKGDESFPVDTAEDC